MSRLTTGMLRTHPDSPDTPITRTSRGGLAGLALAAVIGLVVALFGVIAPGGNTSWRTDGTVVVVKGTGARFLYTGGALHPVLNLTSAKLVAGAQMTVQTVDARSLTGAPQSWTVGIIGAPEDAPAPAALSSAPWTACATAEQTQSGTTTPSTALEVAATPQGRVVPATEAIEVSGPDGAIYLLWQGRRLRIDSAHEALTALGFAVVPPVPVTAAFLDALPAGPDLTSEDVPGRGAPGPLLSSGPTVVGQLFSGPNNQFYLMGADGLVPLTATRFDLLRGDPRTQQLAYNGRTVTVAVVSPDDLLNHQVPAGQGTPGAPGTGWPATPPTPAQPMPGEAPCVVVSPHGNTPTTSVLIVPTGSITGQPSMRAAGIVPSCQGADTIAVPNGVGVLARAMSSGGMLDASTYLVADSGVKYPLPAKALTQLGYTSATTVNLSSVLLDLLPTGPALDPVTAGTAPAVTVSQPARCGA